MRKLIFIYVRILSLTTCLCVQTEVNKQHQADDSYSIDD